MSELKVNVISEVTGANGVVVDSVKLKDGGIVIADAGNIGSTSDVDAIAIGSDGDITLTQDLELQHDGAILSFGANDEVSLTHVHDTGLLLNSTNVIQFNDASQNIGAPSATVLDINATDEIELNATLVDINANVEISGTATTTGVHTFTAVPVFPNNTIETADIQDDAITAAKIADNAVVTAGINADAVTGAKIADDAINSEHYTDGSIDTAHIADAQITAAKMFSGFENGITSTDQYRLTANLTNPGAADITANLERVDDSVFGRIGTGMSVSSGVYTFPSTGVYRIQMIGHFYIPSGNDGAASVDTLISPDSGSNYDILASAIAGSTAGGQLYNTHPSECFVNVTNATNFRVKFTTGSMAATVLVGSTSLNATSFSFMRLGDTY